MRRKYYRALVVCAEHRREDSGKIPLARTHRTERWSARCGRRSSYREDKSMRFEVTRAVFFLFFFFPSVRIKDRRKNNEPRRAKNTRPSGTFALRKRDISRPGAEGCREAYLSCAVFPSAFAAARRRTSFDFDERTPPAGPCTIDRPEDFEFSNVERTTALEIFHSRTAHGCHSSAQKVTRRLLPLYR